MINRYFQRYATEVHCDKCKSFQKWYNWYGHYYCTKCNDIIGFPSGKLGEPSKWKKDATGLLNIPYKHNKRVYFEKRR